jgi:hypothetical protein
MVAEAIWRVVRGVDESRLIDFSLKADSRFAKLQLQAAFP